MSQSIRQSELFAAQDWSVLYRSFSTINFNTSDPVSINLALRQYLQTNYAEDFNDWVASSEFNAIIELLSWISGVLAYKTDIAARENFLETAEAKESVIRLARFLSYNASRNQCSRGLLKVTSIQTDDEIVDAYGNSLRNVAIVWNDQNNPEWFQQMALILNDAFPTSNPFGVPLTSASLAGITTQLYQINGTFGDASLSFSASPGGVSMPFEVINTTFDSLLGFTEVAPNLSAGMHMIYRADGNGNGSPNTGFFFGFKQGQLQNSNVNIAYPVQNQTIDIPIDNINQSDVWVQTIDDAGNVMIDWVKTPTIWTTNITYNSIDSSSKNIFAAITKDKDQVMIRFSDGNFGVAPTGNIRVWYRVSNGLHYQIRPSDMTDVRISIPYMNSSGAKKTLSLTLALATPVANSAPSETIEQIKVRAPQVYATQNRMVSGEDYNVFPLQSNLATKIKALTRVYSGQSRYIDLNDPTGNYKPSTVFSDDGSFYVEKNNNYIELFMTGNISSRQLIDNYILPSLDNQDTHMFVRDFIVRNMMSGVISMNSLLSWVQVSATTTSCTGYLTGHPGSLYRGSMIKITTPTGRPKWVGVDDVSFDVTASPIAGEPGPVTLTSPVPTGAQILAVLPPYISAPAESLLTLVRYKIEQNLSFSLWYDFAAADGSQWSMTDLRTLDGANVNGTAILVMAGEYFPGNIWRLSTAGARHVFESAGAVQFYFNGEVSVDPGNGAMVTDLVRILSVNPNLSNNGQPYTQDLDLTIGNMISYSNGYADPNRIVVTPFDSNRDGYPDTPDIFYRVISPQRQNNYLFWVRNSFGSFTPLTTVVVYEQEDDRTRAAADIGTVAFQIASPTNPTTFWIMTDNGWTIDYANYRYAVGRGPNVAATWVASGGAVSAPTGDNLKFQWNHYAPTSQRIDPSRSNIIDMFILTTEYDNAVRQWIASGASEQSIPVPPTETDLLTTFSKYEAFKMFSDDIVWRPVKYCYLFGAGADPAQRAKFKVVLLPSASMSAGQVQSAIVSLINSYFDAQYWDFGETFYFTELAAYIHQHLATQVASFVIVPTLSSSSFGADFEVQCRADQMFISTAQVSDIVIIASNTPTQLRMR